ncbi:MAG: cytochrome c2 [Chitinophagales bacterium]
MQAQDIDAGKTLFKSNCAACLTHGKGKLTGPDLKDISERVSHKWVASFVTNSSDVIASGDEYANAIFKEFKKVPMTAHPHLTNDDITNIIGHIDDAIAAKAARLAIVGAGEQVGGND